MSYSVFYHKQAEEEVKEIIDWYLERSDTAAAGFLSRLKLAELSIQSTPFAYRIISSAGVRRIVVKKFPYKIYFTVEGAVIYILAIIHFSRSVRYTTRRLKK